VDQELRQDLEDIARSASEALAAEPRSEEHLRLVYESLRKRAFALNVEHGWNPDGQFSTMLPDADEWETISMLDSLYYGQQADVPCLEQICGWATGLLLADDIFG
jgi:hypothetical protein